MSHPVGYESLTDGSAKTIRLSANIQKSSMYDAIVIGLGGMGSASLFELASRGLKALGIEQFDVPHEFGSSHGLTRIIRLAYFESPAYVPLLFRAYERWREIEEHCGEKLLYITGSIDAGGEHTRTVQGSLQACHEFSLQHDLLVLLR
jgi:sarcosine oxidase